MARRIKIKKSKPVIEKEYYEDIKSTDPKTGKEVIKKIKIVRYASRLTKSSVNELKDNMIESINNRVKNAKPIIKEEN